MSKPFVYAPAMNTDMWNHSMTARHLRVLDELGYAMVDPVEKKLACGVIGTIARAQAQFNAVLNTNSRLRYETVGKGGLAPVDDIIEVVRTALSRSNTSTTRQD
jgi:phosphopantothenoylcysteine synthetase/decarboxylase